MRRKWENLLAGACLITLCSIVLYAYVTVSNAVKQREQLINKYNFLVQIYQEEGTKQLETTTEKEEEALNFWELCTNIDTISWEEAKEADIKSEYIQTRVANLVDKLGYSMSGAVKYKDKREEIQSFMNVIDELQKETGCKDIALSDAKRYGEYLLKIFR